MSDIASMRPNKRPRVARSVEYSSSGVASLPDLLLISVAEDFALRVQQIADGD
jgi:hypothetical protein